TKQSRSHLKSTFGVFGEM
ncbi:DNA replication licensing factor Mcm6, partial [Danaus plexippus plexippus]